MNELAKTTEDITAVTNKKILTLADAAVLRFMDEQSGMDVDDMDMDRIIKISKNYAGRVLLDEGKNTANIGLNSGAGGFNVTFVETVADKSSDDNSDEDDES